MRSPSKHAAHRRSCATSQAEVHQLEQLTLLNLDARLAEHGMRQTLASISRNVYCMDCPASFGVDVLAGARHAMRRRHVVEDAMGSRTLVGDPFAAHDLMERRR